MNTVNFATQIDFSSLFALHKFFRDFILTNFCIDMMMMDDNISQIVNSLNQVSHFVYYFLSTVNIKNCLY